MMLTITSRISGFSPEWFELMQTDPLRPGRETLIGRILLEGRVVHIPDVLTDPEYTRTISTDNWREFRVGPWGARCMREGYHARRLHDRASHVTALH